MLGKKVFNDYYWHVCLTPEQPESVQKIVIQAETIANLKAEQDYNVVKYNPDSESISFLYYPDFFDIPFPELAYSWRVNTSTQKVDKRNYKTSLNPPILHRKELFISSDHARQAEYQTLTKTAEDLGLFKNTIGIGYKLSWENLIFATGYELDGHNFVPLGNQTNFESTSIDVLDDVDVQRHKTALSRNNLSAPTQMLAKYGLLDGQYSFFDYGCGRGDDLRNLSANEIQANGWDPYFAEENSKIVSDLVNIGFVINVIEEPYERQEALLGAFSLTKKLLVISVMLYHQSNNNGVRYKDGVLTSRNTFQKYFTQEEIKNYVDSTLGVDSIPMAPGILFVFADKDFEQSFLQNKQRSKTNFLRLIQRTPKERFSLREARKKEQFNLAFEAVQPVKEIWLMLGRQPDKSEVPNLVELLKLFSSFNQALKFVEEITDEEILEQARNNRIDDLLTYLAFQTFSKRQAFKHMEPTLKRDIKVFFGDYKRAIAQATDLIYQLGDVAAIRAACIQSVEDGLGFLDDEHALHLPASLVERLPAILRLYVACAAVLYGDVDNADLVKIHTKSGKLSLMTYDDFIENPMPLLMQRVKIDFRNQQFDIFDYGDEYEPTYLYLKSQHINEEFPHFEEQCQFDEKLKAIDVFEFEGYGPRPEQFRKKLQQNRFEIIGFDIVHSQSIPDLSEPCGENFCYRDFIECGETWLETQTLNIPMQADSYTALYKLASMVLDPVIEYFGMIKLTYGFSSANLSKLIPGRIAPKLDQHAAHELNRLKNPICSRLGAACDFIVEDENMLEVAQWLVENTPFDRLYFYDNDKPVHVSVGPENKREIIVMKKGGKSLVPSVIKISNFMLMKQV